MSGIYPRQEEKRMKVKIKKAPVAKLGKQPKAKKIETPAVKAAKKEFDKAAKKTALAKKKLEKAKEKK